MHNYTSMRCRYCGGLLQIDDITSTCSDRLCTCPGEHRTNSIKYNSGSFKKQTVARAMTKEELKGDRHSR